MEKPPPLTGRESELQLVRNALTAAAAGRGSLLFVNGPAGIGKTRFLDEAAAEAKARGFLAGVGVAYAESPVLYHVWQDALAGLALDGLLREEPPPRLLALYLVSETGLPIVRVERPGFSEDPALLAMMLNNAGEFLRDAIKPAEAEAEGDLMRLAIGGRGVCIARGKTAALLAVYEGRETEIFLREVRRLLEEISMRAGARLDGWDGNKRAVADLGEPLSSSMLSGRYDGIDLSADGQARKFNLFDNVLFGLRRRSRLQPVMVILDDLQWAETSSLGLLHYLARNTRDAPVLLVGAFRSEERDSRPQLRDALAAMARDDLADEIPLGKLTVREAEVFATNLLGAHKIPTDFFERLTENAAGNPLILREVLRQMKETGAIEVDATDGLLQTTRAIERIEVPRRIREAVGLRLAGVDRPDRELLDAAAVCGTRFGTKLVSVVLDEGELKVARQLSSIQRHHGIVLPADGGWRFEHPVLREVIYDGIAPDLRRLIHAEAAKALPELGGTPVEVGEHFAEAGDERAVAPLTAAVDAALQRGAADEAARLMGKAIKVAPAKTKPSLQLQLAQALELANQFPEALAACETAQQLGADAYATAHLRVTVLIQLSRLEEAIAAADDALARMGGANAGRMLSLKARAFNALARFVEAEATARAALVAFPPHEPAGRSEALYSLGASLWYRGDYTKAVEIFNDALILREGIGDRRGICEIFIALGAVMGDQGRLARANELLSLALTVSDKIGDRRSSAVCQVNIAHSLAELGDLEGAQRAAERSAAAGARIGNARLVAWGECIMGIILAKRAKNRDALARFERCANKARALTELRLLATALAEGVGPRIRTGDVEGASRDAAEAAVVAHQIGAKPMVGLVLRARAEAAAASGDLSGSRDLFKAAVEAFDSIGNPAGAAEAHNRWGEAMLRAGDRAEAKAHFARAVELFESGEIKRRASETRTSLVALAQ